MPKNNYTEDKTYLPNTVLGFVLYFLKQKKVLWLVVQILEFVWVLDAVFIPFLAKKLMDVLQNYKGSPQNIWPEISFYILLGGAVWFLTDIAHNIRSYIKIKIEPELEKDVILKVANYTLAHSHKYFADNFAGSLLNKIQDCAKATREIFKIFSQKIIIAAISLAILGFLLFKIKYEFFIIILCWAICHLIITFLALKKWVSFNKDASEAKSTSIGKIVDSLANQNNIKIFANKKFEMSYLEKYQNERMYTWQKTWLYVQKMIIALQITGFIVTYLILTAYEIYAYKNGLITLSDFIYILIATPPVESKIWELTFYLPEFAEWLGTLKQAIETINKPHEIIDVKNAKELKVNKGKIEFQNVFFKYKEKSNSYVFNNQNIIISAGQKVGLVGKSGAGKTTFVNLLLRYFDINDGKILIDGQNIKEVSQESLRRNISLIPQDTLLFHRSLMENIRYGRLNATDDEVFHASKMAYAHEFIKRIPEGYQSLVGERGVKLSGGQKQRIAIARAILKNSPILILDEATSALDSESEHYIQESLKKLMVGKTVIAIAHRLSTLLNMDKISVFEKGKIIEDGNHKELLKKNGYYAKLWKMQSGGS